MTQTRDIIAIGASAGGLEPVLNLVRSLPGDLPASVLVVVHGAPSNVLGADLGAIAPPPRGLRVRVVDRPTPLERGVIYLPATGRHLLVRSRELHAGSGPRENGVRPAIDALFRTAAAEFGPRVIGVVLSGMLDDGTLGLLMIKRRGGVAIAQDPADAFYPSMPSSAIENVPVDHIVPSGELPALLARLVHERANTSPPSQEAAVPRRQPPNDQAPWPEPNPESGISGFRQDLGSKPPSPLTCPECGGTLWLVSEEGNQKYLCHTGHTFTGPGLAADQREAAEEALWTAVRALQEAAELRRQMSARAAARGWNDRAATLAGEATEYDRRADAVRRVVLSDPD